MIDMNFLCFRLWKGLLTEIGVKEQGHQNFDKSPAPWSANANDGSLNSPNQTKAWADAIQMEVREEEFFQQKLSLGYIFKKIPCAILRVLKVCGGLGVYGYKNVAYWAASIELTEMLNFVFLF